LCVADVLVCHEARCIGKLVGRNPSWFCPYALPIPFNPAVPGRSSAFLIDKTVANPYVAFNTFLRLICRAGLDLAGLLRVDPDLRGDLFMFLQDSLKSNKGDSVSRSAIAGFGLALVLALGATIVAEESLRLEPEGCYCVGTVGNVDCDYRDEISLNDIMMLVDHLFISGRRLPNPAEANADGDPAGEISLNDIMTLVDYLYISDRTRILPNCPQPLNHLPQTRIVDFVDALLYVNSVEPYNSATGIRIHWEGDDIADHPYDPLPLGFEWKLLGPYSEAEYANVISAFRKKVLFTNEGRLLGPGSFVACDTNWLPGGIRIVTCDTILIDTLSDTSIYGIIDTLLMVFDTAFTNSQYNLQVSSSGDEGGDPWTTVVYDSLYNVYRYYPSSTTQTLRFIFAVRSRDDRLDPDPTPAWRNFRVVNQKHERDVVVISWSNTADENTARLTNMSAYWALAVNNWIAETGRSGEVHYDPSIDFRRASNYSQYPTMLQLVSKYKVAVCVQDAEVSGAWSSQGYAAQNVMVGLQTGTNVWVAARVPFGIFPTGAPFDTAFASEAYRYFFGVQSYIFPGWSSGFYNTGDGDGLGLPRTEDFIGTFSVDEGRWPALAVDTALLHANYGWAGTISPPVFPFRPFLPEIGAQPQVGYFTGTSETEVLYTYRSKYGPVHPMFSWLSFEGLPVMHRLDRGYFRTVHSLFTPLALEPTTAQVMVDSVLNWLYDMPTPVPGSAPPPPENLWDGFSDLEGRTE